MATSKPHHDAETKAIAQNQDYFELKPRGLNIVWGKEPRYWRIPPRTSSSTGSDGDEAAELVEVQWLEIAGSVKPLIPPTSYQITFVLSFKADASGWSGSSPVHLMAKVGRNGRYKWKRLLELEKFPKEPTEFPSSNDPFVINVPKDQIDTTLYFGLYEVWSGNWKQGLRVHKAVIKKMHLD
ncbi:hypothetical protein DITRI_Ditri10aG0078100 [Diplodiscus trichospermus]